MLSTHLRLLSQWRRPLQRWNRGRLWKVYDQSYDALVGHAPIHRAWLEDNVQLEGLDSLLSIGPGQGELELYLCRTLGCKFSYAESHSAYCTAVEKRFRAAGLGERILERHRGPYQDFIPRHRYALILAIHSWYSFGYNAELLRRTMDALAPGGTFILTVTCAEDFFFRNAVKQQTFSAEELSQWAIEQGYENELHRLRMPVPASALVTDGALTEDAKGTIAFLMGRLWHKIPAAERQDIEQRFMAAADRGGFERVYGLLHFRKPGQVNG